MVKRVDETANLGGLVWYTTRIGETERDRKNNDCIGRIGMTIVKKKRKK